MASPNPPELIRQIRDYIIRGSFAPQPWFATCSAIMTLSVLAGQKYKFQGVAPNIYSWIVGPPGCGKNDPMKAVNNLLARVGATNLIGHSNYASDVAIVDNLETQPVRVDCIDEAVRFLGTASPHKKVVPDLLSDLWSSPLGYYSGHYSATGKKIGDCHYPHVNLMLGSTSSGFIKSCPESSILNGFLSRFLCFFTDGLPTQNFNQNTEVPSKVINGLLNIKNIEYPTTPLHGGDVEMLDPRNEIPSPKEINMSQSALSLYKNMAISLWKTRQNNGEDDIKSHIIPRKFEQIKKIALISAVSDSPNSPMINEAHLSWAYYITNKCYEELYDFIVNKVPRSEREKNLNKIMSYVSSLNEVPLSKIGSVVRGITAAQRDELLKDLVSEGRLITEVREDIGLNNQKKKTTYFSVSTN